MAETPVRIIATGLFTPPNSISNEELVESFNAYVAKFNEENAAAIEAGEIEPLQPSSAEFIEKASGIKARFCLNKEGVLDIEKMRPDLPERPNEELSVMAEIAVLAAREAMKSADLKAEDIDAVVCAASNMQRAYPAMAVEVQSALGIDGFAFDMNVACASAAFGIEAGAGLIRNGTARRVLMVNPEICTGHLNFRDRDSHFIFGDVATAVILERADGEPAGEAYDILDTKMKTVFSNNIRNNSGFLNRCAPEGIGRKDKLFVQEGRKVFKDVVPMVGAMIAEQIAANGLEAGQLRRMWLHQANLNMNVMIAKKVLGRDATLDDAPVVLDRYANTSSAGSIIAFHLHREEVKPGDYGVICGFGAGYSAGSILVKRAA
ncbi:MAG: beta-ketoacyl-ACP synthase III [Pseudomonadota bacterium]